MRLLFLGDIVGRSGREAVLEGLPKWREKLLLDFVAANAENASHGYGLSPQTARDLLAGGIDVLTLGNHSWDRQDLVSQIDRFPKIVRPINYPQGTPGQGSCLVQLSNGHKVLVINVMGRIFMDPLDDPFRTVSELLQRYRLGVTVQAIILDVHAEATSEKMGMGQFFDGYVSLVVGTHTHVPTSDQRILPNGTAYQTDAGMCGDYNSIIGMDIKAGLGRLLHKVPRERPHPAQGEATVSGVVVETDDKTGLAIRISPFRQGGSLAAHFPDF